jgi:nucleoside-diphosphate-sugar epimerase
MRIGVSVDDHRTTTRDMVRRMFSTSPDNPVEYVHPDDVAKAMRNAIGNPQAIRKVLHLGGGASCRVTQYDLVSASLGAMGVCLPKGMMGNQPFYTHWMDTTESQRVLQFQTRSFEDYRAKLTQSMGRWRPVAQPLAPLILWGLRRYLLR